MSAAMPASRPHADAQARATARRHAAAVAAVGAVLVIWCYPVLEVWSRNVGIVGFSQVAPILLSAAGAGLAGLMALAILNRDLSVAAVSIALLSFFFWWYGPVQDELPDWFDDRRLLPIFIVVYAHLAYFMARSAAAASGSGRAVLALLLGFGLLAGLSLARIVQAQIRPSPAVAQPVIAPTARAATERANIIFIMLDEYASEHTMEEVWNSAPGIVQELERRGFFVARDSMSRYDATMWALPTVLNLEYVTGPVEPEVFARFSASLGGEQVATPAEIAGPGFGDLVAKINSNRLFALARNAGYSTTAIEGLSEYYPTVDLAEAADLLYRYADVYSGRDLTTNPLSQALLEQSALRPWLRMRERNRSGHINHDGARFAFDYLASFRPSASARLVYAHIMAPHAPYVFDRNGELPTAASSAAKGAKGLYLEQHQFVTAELLKTVDSLLDHCANACAVVIQSDHGPRPKDTGNDSADVTHQFRVLNALFLPDREYAGLGDGTAPVNVVRHVAARYFGQELPELPDR